MQKMAVVQGFTALVVLSLWVLTAHADEPTVADALEKGGELWETVAPARVHLLPHPRSRVVGRLGKGLPLVVLEKKGKWAKVLTESSARGWVDLSVLRRVTTDRPATGKDSKTATSTGSWGTIRFRVHPWGKVTMDGKVLGTTPMPPVEVSEGTHDILLENDTLKVSRNLRVKVVTGKAVEVRINLDEAPERKKVQSSDRFSTSEIKLLSSAPPKQRGDQSSTLAPASHPSRASNKANTPDKDQSKLAQLDWEAIRASSSPPAQSDGKFVTPLDFCAEATANATNMYVRQKLVLFKMGQGSGGTFEGPGSEKCLEHAAEIFQGVFPMKRFYNVLSPMPAPSQLTCREPVDVSSIGGQDLTPFLRYSLGCADYVAVPVLKQCTGKMETAKDNKGRKHRVYDVTVEADIIIWRREGNTLRRHAAISAEAPTLANRASDLALTSMQSVTSAVSKVGGATGLLNLLEPTKIAEIASYLSATPDDTCMAAGHGRVADDQHCRVTMNFAAFPFAQPMVELRKCLANPPSEDAEVIRCGVRNRSEQLAFNLQKEARGVEGWRLWARILDKDEKPGMVLGKEEGVRVGYGFHAVQRQSDGERTWEGYAKVVHLGAGGDGGEFNPTTLRWRFGGAGDNKTVFEEYPQLGLAVGLAWEDNVLLVPPLLVEPSRNRYWDPGVYYPGLSLQVGYDLSGLVNWSEFWLGVRMGFIFSPGEAMSTYLVDIQVLTEKRIYLGRRLDWFIALGPSLCTAVVKLDKVQGIDAGATGTAFTVGLAFATGFDMTLTADLYLRLGVMWRQHFNSIEEFDLDDGKTWRPGGSYEGEAFSTTYSGLVTQLGLGWVF